MAMRQLLKGCAALVCAAGIHAAAPAPASAEAPIPACGPEPFATAGRADAQLVERKGRIPGLGRVTASIGWDNRQQLTLAGDAFEVTRAFTPLTREVEIELSGSGETAVVVRFGGVDGLSVTKGNQVVRGTADPEAIRTLLSGRAVTAFRERIGNYERRLMAGGVTSRWDDPHADGFVLAGAFLASLAGDPSAVGRARDLITRRIRSKLRAVGLQFNDCVRDYERYLLMVDEQRTYCLDAANSREDWYVRVVDRLGCEAEFIAGAFAGEGQFISCTALGSVI